MWRRPLSSLYFTGGNLLQRKCRTCSSVATYMHSLQMSSSLSSLNRRPNIKILMLAWRLPTYVHLCVHTVTLFVLVMGEAQKMPRNRLRGFVSRLSSSSLVIVLMLSWYLSAAASDRDSAASALCRNSFTCSRSS